VGWRGTGWKKSPRIPERDLQAVAPTCTATVVIRVFVKEGSSSTRDGGETDRRAMDTNATEALIARNDKESRIGCLQGMRI
jgi:hypothetical protein